MPFLNGSGRVNIVSGPSELQLVSTRDLARSRSCVAQASATRGVTGDFPQDWPSSKCSIVDKSRHFNLAELKVIGWRSLVIWGRVPHMPINLVRCLVCDNMKRETR